MKAEKVLGIAACAFACATGSVFANTTNSWFGVAPSGSNIGLASATTNGVAVTVDNGIIQLDNDFDSALTFTPTDAAPSMSDGLVTITSSAVLTPSDVSDLGPVSGAHAGFAVAVDGSATNFYGYASAASGNGWVKLTNVAPVDPETTPTTFTIAINYRDSKVSFYQGSTLLTDEGSASVFSISNNFTQLNNVAAYGSGSISSITSQYEVAVAIGKDGKKYGSTVEAVNTTGESSIQVIDPTTGNAAAQQLAANGIQLWECDVLNVEPDAAIALEPATKGVEGKIALKLAVDPDPGVSVKFQVKQGGSLVSDTKYDADAIGIPLTTGTYTIVPDITAAP